MAEAHAGKPDTFLTLTSRRRPGQTPQAAARALAEAWPRLHRRALAEATRNIDRRKTPVGKEPPDGWKRDSKGRVGRQVKLRDGKLPYLAVFEATRLGWPHLHILTRAIWIDHAWLSAQMDELVASPVVYVERITNTAKVAAYVAKYVGKAPHRFATCKRYWQSASYRVRPKVKGIGFPEIPGKWETHNASLSLWIDQWETLGWKVERVRPHAAIARAPP